MKQFRLFASGTGECLWLPDLQWKGLWGLFKTVVYSW